MPLLLNILQNAGGSEYRKLRAKAMECAGLIGRSSCDVASLITHERLIAIAVGRDVFRPDANTFIELLMRIQSMSLSLECNSGADPCADSPPDLQDTMLTHYLIATWAKVCQAMGEEFEPYLPVVMPPLLAAASTKTEVSVYGQSVPPPRHSREC